MGTNLQASAALLLGTSGEKVRDSKRSGFPGRGVGGWLFWMVGAPQHHQLPANYHLMQDPWIKAESRAEHTLLPGSVKSRGKSQVEVKAPSPSGGLPKLPLCFSKLKLED